MSYRSILRPDVVPLAEEDQFYRIEVACEADHSDRKVDLGIGAYRDDNGQSWILPSVKRAQDILIRDPSFNHDYLPVEGNVSFTSAAQKIILGADSPAIKENRLCPFQTISGTGAVSLASCFLSEFMPSTTILVPTETWTVHWDIFAKAHLQADSYPYLSANENTLDLDGMLSALKSARPGSIVLLHPCAHNPTGIDPTDEQWKEIAMVFYEQNLVPLFDCAYQGFASGSLSQDNFAIRHFVEEGFEIIIAQSFSKIMGLYGQQVGVFHYIAPPGSDALNTVNRVASQIALRQLATISTPPSYGARIASIILNNPGLLGEWKENLHTMFTRITQMRRVLYQELTLLGTPGNWEQITRQTGMFSYTDVTAAQVQELQTRWHVYILSSGRISMAGLNTHNVRYFAEALDDVVRRIK
ncbi:aspartate aminotransferase [Aspergillus ellipticus CBS 707.79]|uniref:aspartate transaminase n=1 Tax=Aspergillus ellipticus CBS 707.79 TaxID=1448320 RepID=A0A319DCF3_9EURO|nr:aspartate aminotransferase [Aspergillus ellipticus CBS 707.79]